jgi:hypothetical protein
MPPERRRPVRWNVGKSPSAGVPPAVTNAGKMPGVHNHNWPSYFVTLRKVQ